MRSPRDEFARIAALKDSGIDLAEAALWIAAEEYPGLDVPAYLARLDDLAQAAAPTLPKGADLSFRVAHLNRFLFVECGFRGNRNAYYDPRNSYLNEVIERRLGIPITLSLVYMAVAERVGLDTSGLSFPGHFLLKCVGERQAGVDASADEGEREVVVDAFAGGTLSFAECEGRLSAAAGRPVALDPALHLRAASRREVLVRVLTNLKQIFLSRDDHGAALSCCDRILLLTPGAPRELEERDALRARVRVH